MYAVASAALLHALRRASARSAAVVHQDLKGRLDSLATIASVAPWFGILGTIDGIFGSFGSGPGEKTAALARLCHNLSEAMFPTALGLVVAVPALWGYRYLTSSLLSFDREMEAASLELVNHLVA